MKRNNRGALIGIILLTICVILLNIPKTFSVNLSNWKMPFMTKSVTLHKTYTPFNANSILSLVHVNRDLSFRKGLDLEGGTSITLKANMQGIKADQRNDALDSAKTVIERRINFFGVSEPVVQTAHVNNDYRIIAEIPGITDVNQAIALIGTTAKLTFWEEGASPSGTLTASPSATVPIGISSLLGSAAKQTDLTGGDLKSAAVVFDPNSGQPQVQLNFTGPGTKKFADITSRNVGKIVAIALDNQVVEAPRVQQVITTGNAVITGSFTVDQAKALQVQLNAGALPVSLSVLQQQAIGATLGTTSLQKSLIAGILGFIIIVIFMVVLYGRLGVIASVALGLYTLIVLALFRLIPVTLTLAGIAGLILSVGIAVDANILIFERMREEERRGKPREAALELGFTRAWASIRDSNAASIITCIILYIFGTGMVRGFAVTLFLGVIVSLFSAVVVTRTLIRVFYKA